MHDDYKPLECDPDKLQRCPVCGSPAALWQYSESETSPRSLLIACTHGERIGPQDGLVYEGCPLYMPKQDFYRETIRDAMRFWNEYARALSTLRRKNNWQNHGVLREADLGGVSIND